MLAPLMRALTPLHSPFALLVAVVVLALSGAGPVEGQTETGGGAVVAVRNVSFSSIRAPGGGPAWTEAAVELSVTTSPGDNVYARWADFVRVTLNLGIRKRDGGFEFYRATAEAVSLEAGRAVFRFYLPPEVARREQLTTVEPHAYVVDLAIQGRAVPSGSTNVSAVINSAEALRSFKDRVSRSATLNDGVLLPQIDSPFASVYAGETPTFVRR